MLYIYTNLREAEPRGLGLAPESKYPQTNILLFQKRSKSVSSASQKSSTVYVPTSAKRSHGVWGWPQNPSIPKQTLFFSRKEAKALVLLRRRAQQFMCQPPRSGATGSGAGPRIQVSPNKHSSFPEKKQKRWFCFAEEPNSLWANLREAEPRGLGLAPEYNQECFLGLGDQRLSLLGYKYMYKLRSWSLFH
jgi:hypothetical protein